MLAVGALVLRAGIGAANARIDRRRRLAQRFGMRFVVFVLHLLQPFARLAGRLSDGLTPWRRRGPGTLAVPSSRRFVVWSERWFSPRTRLQAIGRALLADGLSVARGGDYDRWELEVTGGALGSARVRMGIEEHGCGRQLARFHVWPRPAPVGMLLVAVFAPVAVAAALQGAFVASAVLASVAIGTVALATKDCARAVAAMRRAILTLPERLEERPAPEPVSPSIPGEPRPETVGAGRAQ